MKTIYKNSLIACTVAMTAVTFTACDEVGENDRYILGEAIKVERGVLLEDFTGQNCINCPEAHKVIEQLEEQYGEDKFIAVSIHCGGFGIDIKDKFRNRSHRSHD